MAEVNRLVSRLIGSERESATSDSRRASRPSSIQGTGQFTPLSDVEPSPRILMQSMSTQTDSSPSSLPVYEDSASTAEPAAPKREYITYNKGVQTEGYTDDTTIPQTTSDDDLPVRSRKRLSRRDQERDEEIRLSLRKEIEEELRDTLNRESTISLSSPSQQRFPLRTLTNTELNAVVASSEFVSFVERSSKVIERALDLDDEYDLLADYTRTSTLDDSDDDMNYARSSKSPILCANHSSYFPTDTPEDE